MWLGLFLTKNLPVVGGGTFGGGQNPKADQIWSDFRAHSHWSSPTRWVTAMVDTFPIRVACPTDSATQRALFTSKYQVSPKACFTGHRSLPCLHDRRPWSRFSLHAIYADASYSTAGYTLVPSQIRRLGKTPSIHVGGNHGSGG